MDFDKFRTDEQLEVEGVWRDIGEGGRLKIASMGNPAYREMMRKRQEPFTELIERGMLDEEAAKKMTVEVMAQTIFLGMEGITDKGRPIDDTMQNRAKMLDESSSFRAFVVQFASRMENFKRKVEKESMGNSSAVSSGT